MGHLSVSRTTTEQERDDKYHRLLSASLQSFSMFISALSDDQREDIGDRLRQLLRNVKFWKFGKHTVSMVCVLLLCGMLFCI